MSLINLIIALVICLFVWVLYLTYQFYQKTVILRRKSSVLLVRTIKSHYRFRRILKITNSVVKGLLIYKTVKNVIETVKTASFLMCLVFKKR